MELHLTKHAPCYSWPLKQELKAAPTFPPLSSLRTVAVAKDASAFKNGALLSAAASRFRAPLPWRDRHLRARVEMFSVNVLVWALHGAKKLFSSPTSAFESQFHQASWGASSSICVLLKVFVAAHPDTQSAYAIMDIEQPLKLRYAKSFAAVVRTDPTQIQREFMSPCKRRQSRNNFDISGK